MNELATTNNGEIGIVISRMRSNLDTLKDRESVIKFLDDMHRVDQVLNALHAAQDVIEQYNRIEVETYFKLLNLRQSRSVTLPNGRDNKIVCWLEQLSSYDPKKLDDIKEHAELGMQHYYNIYLNEKNYYRSNSRRRRSDLRDKALENPIDFYVNNILEEYEYESKVYVSASNVNYAIHAFMGDEYDSSYDGFNNVRHAAAQEARTQLLRRNAVCIGDGLYVNAFSEEFKKHADKSIQIRIESIVDDISSLIDLISTANIKSANIDMSSFPDEIKYDIAIKILQLIEENTCHSIFKAVCNVSD